MPVAGLPPALAGLRIGLITDVHRSRWVSHDDVARAVDLLMAARPDLIVLGGDYVTWGDRRYVGAVRRSAARRCRRRTASSPSSATTTTITTCRRRSRSSGVAGAAGRAHAADDPRRGARARRHPVLDQAAERHRRAGRAARTDTVILLAHDPRRLTEAAALDIPLVLSGHTHGGQVVLPGVGAVAAQKFPVVAGHRADRTNTTMFVSRGVGTVYVPVRINCPPEVARADAAAGDA